MYKPRRLSLRPGKSHLLLGARRTGKSTWIRHEMKDAVLVDLLKTDEYFEYRSRPALLRERYSEEKRVIVIDEVQKIPELLDEVHWMIENTGQRFLLSGSSARKLRRGGLGNLAGRLSTVRMLPLTCSELEGYDLDTRLQYGSLPPMVFNEDPWHELKDYCGDYLHEEIQAESLVRNLPAFTRFLETAAIGNAQIVSYATIARDCGVAGKTIRDYYQILEDTLLGYLLEPLVRTRKRRAILSPKFYFFDCGIPQVLLDRRLSAKTPEYGLAFEHAMVLEAMAAMHYEGNIHDLRYWRSTSGFEVDLILNQRIGVEFKSGRVQAEDAKGLNALGEDLALDERWIVCTEKTPRRLDTGVEVLPWREYVDRLAKVKG